MRPRETCWAFVAVLGVAAGLGARELVIADTVTVVGETTWLFAGPIRCDAESNVFFVPGNRDGTEPDAAVKVSADGKKSTRFSVRSMPELRDVSDGVVYAMAVGYAGELYLVVGNADGQSIVTLDSEGRYRSRTWLGRVGVSAFAPFKSGEFLLWGRWSAEGGPSRLSILPAGGGERKEISLDRSSTSSPARTTKSDHGVTDIGLVEPGQDGNVYMARVSEQGTVRVFAIAASGDVVQRIDLTPPRRRATLVSMKLSANRLAAFFVVGTPSTLGANPPRWISVYDLSGETIATYSSVPGGLVCYSSGGGIPDAFLFHGSDGKWMQLVHASAGY
jgi:hypothetical protein